MRYATLFPNKANPVAYRVEVKHEGIQEYFYFKEYKTKRAAKLAAERFASDYIAIETPETDAFKDGAFRCLTFRTRDRADRSEPQMYFVCQGAIRCEYSLDVGIDECLDKLQSRLLKKHPNLDQSMFERARRMARTKYLNHRS